MKKILIYLSVIFLFGCTKNDKTNNCFPFIPINLSVNLDLPEFLELRTPGNSKYIAGGQNGIVIYNINGTQFKAYDRACPNHITNCAPMEIENNIRLKCSCDGVEYNILNGAPLSGDSTCFAKEYFVENLNGTVLRITNF